MENLLTSRNRVLRFYNGQRANFQEIFSRFDKNGNTSACAISLAYFLLSLLRLEQPSVLYYDEPHYVISAIEISRGLPISNREHPMFGKEVIAFLYRLSGESWFSARVGSLGFAALGLYGFQRALFWLQGSRLTSSIFALLLSTNCLYFVTSRQALLDPFMLGNMGISLAFLSHGLVSNERRVLHFSMAGAAIGLALASKWTAAPVAILMALLTIARFKNEPVRIVKLGSIAVLFALSFYLLTFLPIMITKFDPIEINELLPFHRAMSFYLGALLSQHPYQSHWWDWPLGVGQMWLYDGRYTGDGRAVILAQNPVSTLLSAPSVIWATVLLLTRRDWCVGILAIGYALTLGLWALVPKPNLYLYHYNVPSIFALAILAILMTRAKGGIQRVLVVGTLAAHVAAFAYFYPVMSAEEMRHGLEARTSHRGWFPNPNAMSERGAVGNGVAVQKWANSCLADPTQHECREAKSNTLQR